MIHDVEIRTLMEASLEEFAHNCSLFLPHFNDIYSAWLIKHIRRGQHTQLALTAPQLSTKVVMSWIKLPCILVANVGIYRTFTPPNVSAKGEQLPVITLWDWYLSLSRSVINPLKVYFEHPPILPDILTPAILDDNLWDWDCRSGSNSRVPLPIMAIIDLYSFHTSTAQ